jgi:dihydropyrimidinase
VNRFDLIITGGQVVTPSGLVAADLGILEGRIAAIASSLSDEGEQVDARGLYVMPGLVDPHVHPIHAEDYGSVSEAAACGGVTTVLHHLYVDPDEGAPAALPRARAEAAETSLVDFSFHVRLSRLSTMAAEIAPVAGQGVTSFKMFMAYRERGIMVDDAELLTAMQGIRHAGGLALLHAEDGLMIEALQLDAERQGRTRAEDYASTRPPRAEANAVTRALQIAEMTGCPVYFVHTTCAEALTAQTRAKLDGLRLYVETCPQYLLLTEACVASHGARAKIAPPLRTEGDQRALWHAVESGLVDAIGSDHSAYAPEYKEGLEERIFRAGFGAPGIEHMLPLLMDRGVRQGRLSLPRLVELLSSAPARIFGLAGKGTVGIGADADLVLFDPERPFVIEAARGHGRAYYSLYEGWTGKGAIRSVLRRGTFLVRDGELVGRPGTARFLARRSY